MKVSTHAKSQVVGLVDNITSFGLRIGIPVAIFSFAFLMVVVFAGHMRNMAKMTPTETVYLTKGIPLAAQALLIAGTAIVVAVVLRLARFETTGQMLSLAGAVFYFGSPVLLSTAWNLVAPEGRGLLAVILSATRSLGGVALLPGLTLILRDAILRIWTGISVRRVLERRWGDEEEQRKKPRKPVLLGACWDMSFCRDFVRDVCPAFAAKKACWKLKVGCYCDESTILRAMTASGKDNVHARGIIESLGLDKAVQSRFTKKLRRERCKRCGIYAEHQRQKYRLLSPMVFPTVLLVLYAYYGAVSQWTWRVMEKADKFMSFLAYRSTGGYSFGDDGRILTVLAVAWLTIIVISYALRALEYLVFELQV